MFYFITRKPYLKGSQMRSEGNSIKKGTIYTIWGFERGGVYEIARTTGDEDYSELKKWLANYGDIYNLDICYSGGGLRARTYIDTTHELLEKYPKRG